MGQQHVALKRKLNTKKNKVQNKHNPTYFQISCNNNNTQQMQKKTTKKYIEIQITILYMY